LSEALIIRDLGLVDYTETWQRMQQFTDNRDDSTVDEIWLLEHPPVFTQGQAGKEEHLLFPGDIPVVKVDRGGQVTYHGPGQLVAYVLLDIKRRKIGVRELVTMIEQVIVGALAAHNVNAYARPDAPGVYVDEAKVASLGLRVRKGCTFHGLALNVAMDLAPFSRINPCGYAGMRMVQASELGGPNTIATAKQEISRQFISQLKISELTEVTGFEA
jgi:lipoyl(octanoyl) transferase